MSDDKILPHFELAYSEEEGTWQVVGTLRGEMCRFDISDKDMHTMTHDAYKSRFIVRKYVEKMLRAFKIRLDETSIVIE